MENQTLDKSDVNVTMTSLPPPMMAPGVVMMPAPEMVPGCPRGLEYLVSLDQVLIHQQVELFEVMTNIQTNNRYVIKNSLGQQCFYAYEDTDLCMRICCKQMRGFDFYLLDNHRQQVMAIRRQFKCCHGCCWCADSCGFEVQIESPIGTVIGRVRQRSSFWIPCFDIIDQHDQVVLTIRGPCCVCPGPCCTCDFDFNIFPARGEGEAIGAITKQYSGLGKECFTNATNFSITFPVDLDVKIKGVLVGAAFLLDLMFFENNNQ